MLKVRWTTSPMGGGTREAEIAVTGMRTEGSLVAFLDRNNRPILVVPQARLIDAVEKSPEPPRPVV